MTRDGFTLLVMGWTGPRALEFKLRYIAAFNAQEEALREVGRSAENIREELAAVLQFQRETAAMSRTLFSSIRETRADTAEIKEDLRGVGTTLCASPLTAYPAAYPKTAARRCWSAAPARHRPPDRHDERDGGIDLLLRPGLGRVEVAPAVGLAHDIADAPLQHRIAVLLEAAGPHRGSSSMIAGEKLAVVDRNSTISISSARSRWARACLQRLEPQ